MLAEAVRSGGVRNVPRSQRPAPFYFAGPAPAPPAAGAAPTGAAEIVTLNLVLKASTSSDSSRTDMLPIASRISSLLIVAFAIVVVLPGKIRRLRAVT